MIVVKTELVTMELLMMWCDEIRFKTYFKSRINEIDSFI